MQKRKRSGGPGWLMNRELGLNKRNRMNIHVAVRVISKHVRGIMNRARYLFVRKRRQQIERFGVRDMEQFGFMYRLEHGRMTEEMSAVPNTRWSWIKMASRPSLRT